MLMRSGGQPMWRRISGNTPWPIAPKPTMMIRPGKSSKCNWLMLQGSRFGFPGAGLRGYQSGAERASTRPLADRFGRRFGRDRRDPVQPAAERRIVDLERQEARRELLRGRLLQG